jgi:hypothetical protein
MLPIRTTRLEFALLAGSDRIVIWHEFMFLTTFVNIYCNYLHCPKNCTIICSHFKKHNKDTVQYTNKFNLPEPVVRFLMKDTYSRGSSEYSATEIMASPKIKRMQEQYDHLMVRDVSDMFASRMGTVMHHMLEKMIVEGYINEERLYTTMDDVVISGAIDLQHDTGEGLKVIDFKSTKAWALMQSKREWEQQLNIYKWLVETVKRKKVIRLQVMAWVKDWSKFDAREGYPEGHAVMVEVPLWDSVRTELYIRERLNMHRDAKVAHDFGEELQPCTKEERWEKETIYAVKREGRKTAIRIFKTIEEATELAEKEKGYVETRAGESTRCIANYCGVNEWCEQFKGIQNATK